MDYNNEDHDFGFSNEEPGSILLWVLGGLFLAGMAMAAAICGIVWAIINN
jgi:hypothetical protein